MNLGYFPKHRDEALLVLRLVIGAIFLYHGIQKLGLWSEAPAQLSSTMLLIMRILSILEPLAGLAMITGLYTDVAAIVLMVVMAGAMGMKIKGNSSFNQWEFDLLLFAGNLVIASMGAGRFTVRKQ